MRSPRLHYMDWLRVLATAVVVLFHCCMFFTPVEWHMKNDALSMSLFLPVVVVDLWIMPLFFLLAGMAAWSSLGRRSPGVYLRERVLRLLVPFYGVGVLLLLPPQLWFDQLTHGAFEGSFLCFYEHYFLTLNTNTSSLFFLGFWPGHLWFLRMLFVVSVLALPVLLLLKREAVLRGLQSVVDRAARVPLLGAMAVFILLFAAMESLLQPTPGQHGWDSFGMYMTSFLSGVVLMGLSDLRGAVAKALPWLAVLAVVTTVAYTWAVLTGFASPLTAGQPIGKELFIRVLRGAACFSWMAMLLGVGMRFLDASSERLKTLGAVALPVYVLHQTVLLIVGALVIPREWSIAVKFLVIASVSGVSIWALVRFAILPSRWLRFAFGMK